MENIFGYAEGFLDGAKAGKTKFLMQLGGDLSEYLKNFIDSNARVSPEMLHHIYEWHQVGQPGARLFDIDYVVSGNGISFSGRLSQSKSIKSGSTTPFYNKATIMENGIPVTIKPKNRQVLRFEQDGETYFVPTGVVVDNPGGDMVRDGFKTIFNSFFTNQITQSFLTSSGIKQYLETPKVFKNNLAAGKRGGRSVGYQVGLTWMANASGGVL